MSYIDATIINDGKTVQVWERDDNGFLKTTKYNAEYYCYEVDEKGVHSTLFHDRFQKASRINFKNRWELKQFVENYSGPPLFESDIQPDMKVLSDFYYKAEIPKIQVTFFDIENDADLENKGWPTITNPYGDITSIAFYHQWKDEKVLITTPPPGYDGEEFTAEDLGCDRVIYTKNEKELLYWFLLEIEESDVLSGWNSSKYDIPYVIESLKAHLGKDDALSALCRDGIKARKRLVPSKYGDEDDLVYKLVGRVDLDYMELYKKYTFQELPSYSLENVAEHELGYGKLSFKGTLPELYRNDYKKFLKYNIHDVNLLRDLDIKLSFLDIGNRFAHDCCCKLGDIMGSVVPLDAALISFSHHELNQVIPDKGSDVGIPEYISIVAEAGKSSNKYSGAWVAELDTYDEDYNVVSTKKGLHGYIGSVDITSEYPNSIIANNISLETIIWNADRKNGDIVWPNRMIYNRSLQDDIQKEKDFTEMCKDGKLADNILKRTYLMREAEHNGDWSRIEQLEDRIWGARNDIIGIVPRILTLWFDERKQQQKIMWECYKNRVDILTSHQIDVKNIPDSLTDVLGDDHIQYVMLLNKERHYNNLQSITKVRLNSIYGAVGNKHSHFYSLAASEACTLTGQSIVKFMGEQCAEIISGVADHTADCIKYGDTDSVDKNTIITTDIGDMTVEDLFVDSFDFWVDEDKEYASGVRKVLAYKPKVDSAELMEHNYVYRHKVKKGKWKIETEEGFVIVTEDHSCMVERDEVLIEVKPRDMLMSDVLIEVKN